MTKFMTFIISGAMLTVVSASAQANIICRDGYEVLPGGQEIATPYCNDAALAEAARAAGGKVSDSALRNNPNLKDETCAWLGNNAAARDDCPGSGDDNDD